MQPIGRTLLVLSVLALPLANQAAQNSDEHDVAHSLRQPPTAGGDLLDPRTPLPLLPPMAAHQKANMRQHLEAVQAIVDALSRQDFDAIARHARTMGYTEQTAQMCQHMGARGPSDFTERALNFHHSADALAEAAATRSQTTVATALAKVLNHCTGCHARYRQEIIER